MSGSEPLDMAALATSGILTVDQLAKAMEASHQDDDRDRISHLTKAAVGAAVALGAWELLRRDEADGKISQRFAPDHEHHSHDAQNKNQVQVSPGGRRDQYPPGHTRRLAEEIVGAYSLGQDILGHRQHRVIHAVAEALGAIAAVKNVRDYEEASRK